MHKTSRCTLVVIMLAQLTACGGGTAVNGNPGSAATTLSARFSGVYVNDGTQACGTTSFVDRSVGSAPFEVRLPSMPDSLAVDANNMAYRVCGNQLWIGPMTGTLTQVPAPSGTPLSGMGSLSWTGYASGSGTIGAITGHGTLLASADGNMVTGMSFSGSAPNASVLRFSQASAAGRVTLSYTSLAGVFREENFYPLYTAPTGSLAVKSDGTFSGANSGGTFSGQISAFDSRQGVHQVRARVQLAATGMTLEMNGVMAPTETATGGNGRTLPGVLVALTGNGIGFVGAYVR